MPDTHLAGSRPLEEGLDGIVFDLDGTLWDSTRVVARAWDSAVQRLAPEAGRITHAAVMGVMGLAHREIGERLLPRLFPAQREPVLAACYAEEEALLRKEGAPLYPGVAEGVPLLAARVPLAIASNCQTGYIEAFLDLTGLGCWFRDHECHGNTRLSKGENLALVMQRCGLHRVVYVGDTQGDQVAAAQAGTDFLHVSYGFGRPDLPCDSVDSFAEVARRLLARVPGPSATAAH